MMALASTRVTFGSKGLVPDASSHVMFCLIPQIDQGAHGQDVVIPSRLDAVASGSING